MGSGYRMNAQKWQKLRRTRLGNRLKKGKTACRYCGVEMWHPEFESIPQYTDRIGGGRLTKSELQNRVATIDHVIPLSDGGHNHPSNLTTMCNACNTEKDAMQPEDWIAYRATRGAPLTRAAARHIRKHAKRARVFARKFDTPRP